MSELALQLIAENKAKHQLGKDATYLDLGNCGLKEVPTDIAELPWLKTLVLSSYWYEFDIEKNRWIERKSQNRGGKNNIRSLSPALHQLKQLTKIVFNALEISNLEPLRGLANLQSIYCHMTQIRDLKPLKGLINLQYISCYNTQISDLEPLKGLTNLKYISCHDTHVSNLEPLKGLTNLQYIDCSGTNVSDLGPLENLTNLRFISCSGTKVSVLDPLEGLIKLQSISCSETKVSDFGPLKGLINLQSIYCSGTNVVDLKPLEGLANLKYVDCHDTQVSNLEPLLSLIKKDSAFKSTNNRGNINVENCPITTPPPEIVKQGNQAILRYFEELEKAKGDTIRLAEAKCLILGEGGAGKTSLVRKLLNKSNPLPKGEESTKGIDVFPHNIKLPNGMDFRLNLWDFGGQEIYHATHQFFLTKRSLYILLDDTRKGEKTVNDPTFNYWLQVTELYSGNSPLLIVQNEKGDRSNELDLKGMQGRFGFVKDSKATNLLTCRGLDDVWSAIIYWLQQLPHIGEEQPKVWLDIRQELERMANKEKQDHITLQDYYRICTKHTIPEKDRALFLSRYLHDFGAFLHFQDHPLLRKMLVLNNQWATDGVYKILDNETVKKAFGRFTRAHLKDIWSGDRYADQHDELLALMEKFELCYKLPDAKEDTWLAPQLLTATQPEALTWDENNNLRIRYEYEFMPKGLLSQHIVRMHRYMIEPDLAWKSGAVFERADSKALVKEAWGGRNISLQARGPQGKELLTLLSEDFDKMHERLEGLKVKKMIPCNCSICGKSNRPHFYEHDDLTTRKTKGKPTVECRISYEDVSVRKLLDEVFALNVQNPRQLLADGYIEDALRAMPPSNEVSHLLGQFKEAERRFLHNLISREEYNIEKSKVSAAALKLMK